MNVYSFARMREQKSYIGNTLSVLQTEGFPAVRNHPEFALAPKYSRPVWVLAHRRELHCCIDLHDWWRFGFTLPATDEALCHATRTVDFRGCSQRLEHLPLFDWRYPAASEEIGTREDEQHQEQQRKR